MRTFRPILGLIATLAVTVPVAFAPPARAQSGNAEAVAQSRFSRGREHFLAHSYEPALAEFRAAYELVPSPNTLLYIARCLVSLERRAEAFTAFQRAGSLAADRARTEPRFAATRDAARAEGGALEARIGRLSVRVLNPPQGVRVTVHGEEVPRAGWEVPTPVDPGAIEVVATAPGHVEFRRSFDVAAGATVEATVELANEPPPVVAVTPRVDPPGSTPGGDPLHPVTDVEHPPPDGALAPPAQDIARYEGGGVRIGGIVVAGVGVVGAVLFGFYGSMAQSRYDQLGMVCGMGPCDPSLQPQIDEGAQYQVIANVGLGVAAVGLLTGVIMIAVGGPHRVEPAPARGEAGPRSARRTLRPTGVSVLGLPGVNGGSWIGVGGAF